MSLLRDIITGKKKMKKGTHKVESSLGETIDLMKEGKILIDNGDGTMSNIDDYQKDPKSEKGCIPPFTQLRENGIDFLTDDNGDIVVGIGKKLSSDEGWEPRKSEEGLEFTSISEDKIKNYNSMWELTNTGWNQQISIWDTSEELCPYVSLNGKWYRWDEKMTLRRYSGMLKWSTENIERGRVPMLGKILKSVYFNESPFGSEFVSKGKTTKIGRNQKCPCSSGKKYKRCCGK